MFLGKKVAALLLMAGSGERFGGLAPKQFYLLQNKPIYRYALETLLEASVFDQIILVSHPDWVDIPHPYVIKGGKNRQESAYLGLKALDPKPDLVLIHDAARPFLTKKMIEENLEKASAYGAVDTCIPSTDTPVFAPDGERIENIPPRKAFFRGQTPQTFRYDWIMEAHEKALRDGLFGASDDCQLLLRMGKKVYITKGSEKNIKVTTEADLAIVEALFSQNKTPPSLSRS